VIRESLDGPETVVVECIVSAQPGSVATPDIVELPPIAER
jgi:hypothetical protein